MTNRGDMNEQFEIYLSNVYGSKNIITQDLKVIDEEKIWRKKDAKTFMLRFKVQPGKKHVVTWKEQFRN